eukprot:6198383-Pleurochrysis_carterae.AAC.1
MLPAQSQQSAHCVGERTIQSATGAARRAPASRRQRRRAQRGVHLCKPAPVSPRLVQRAQLFTQYNACIMPCSVWHAAKHCIYGTASTLWCAQQSAARAVLC